MMKLKTETNQNKYEDIPQIKRCLAQILAKHDKSLTKLINTDSA